MRAYELAKELGMETKKLLESAKSCGVAVKSNLSAVSDEDAAKIRSALAAAKKPAAARAAPARKPAARTSRR